MSKHLLQNKVKLHYKLPTSYNNGNPIPDQDIVDVKNFFIDRYDGLSVDSPSEGFGRRMVLFIRIQIWNFLFSYLRLDLIER